MFSFFAVGARATSEVRRARSTVSWCARANQASRAAVGAGSWPRPSLSTAAGSLPVVLRMSPPGTPGRIRRISPEPTARRSRMAIPMAMAMRSPSGSTAHRGSCAPMSCPSSLVHSATRVPIARRGACRVRRQRTSPIPARAPTPTRRGQGGAGRCHAGFTRVSESPEHVVAACRRGRGARRADEISAASGRRAPPCDRRW